MIDTVRIVSFLLATSLVSGAVSGSCNGRAGWLLTDGDILTMDQARPQADWILIRGERIVDLGNSPPPALDDCIEVHALSGRTVIPGLIDSHVHFIRQANYPGFDVRPAEGADSIGELIGLLGEAAEQAPEGVDLVVIGGIDPDRLDEKRLPAGSELDRVETERVIYLQRGFSGPAVTNAAGRRLFGDNGVEVGDDGAIARGRATNAAFAVLDARQSGAERSAGFIRLMTHANRLGVTTVFDEGGTPFPGAANFDPDNDYDTLHELWRDDALTVRIRAQFGAFDDRPERGAIEERVDNAWARFGDDMLKTVAMGEHVVAFPRRGEVSDAYPAKAMAIAAAGWPHEQHSASIRENRQHLAGIEAADAKHSIEGLRWSLAHVFELGAEEDQALLERVKSLGMGLRLQNHGYTVRTGGFPLGRLLGGDNAGPLYRTLLESGVPLGAGTDGALGMPVNPWFSIYYMVTGRDNQGKLVNAGQTIDRMDALRLFTRGSAWFSFEEDELGVLKPGAHADLAVLNADFREIGEQELLDIESVWTLVGGQLVYRASAAP